VTGHSPSVPPGCRVEEGAGDPAASTRVGSVDARLGVVVTAALVTVACTGSAGTDGSIDPPRVERVEPTTTVEEPIAMLDDETLLALAPADDRIESMDPDTLLRSDDRGATWEPVTLPDAPDGVAFGSGYPRIVDGVAVVGGRVIIDALDFTMSAGDAYVWTSVDGVTWHGTHVAGPGPAFSQAEVDAVDGALLAGAVTGNVTTVDDIDGFALLRSADRGRTWTAAAVPPLDGLRPALRGGLGTWATEDGTVVMPLAWESSRLEVEAGVDDVEPEDPPEPPALTSPDDGATWVISPCPVDTVGCTAPGTGAVQARAAEDVFSTPEVSNDGGATWHPFELDDATPSLSFPMLGGIVELPTGGWLARFTGEPDSTTSFSFLVRSDDGLRWQRVDGPAACDERDDEPDDAVLPDASASDAFAIGETLLVEYTCEGASEIRTVSPDGTRTTPVEGTGRTGTIYGQRAGTDDVVVLPEQGDDGAIAALLWLGA